MSGKTLDLDRDRLLVASELLRDTPKELPKAVSRALNRALTTTRSNASKRLTETYATRSSTLKKDIFLKRAKSSKLNAELDVKGQKLSLRHFKVRPSRDTTGSRRAPVKAEVVRGSPFPVERGFVWNGNVFRRAGRNRLPVKLQKGPAVAQMLGQEQLFKETVDGFEKAFSSRLDHEVEAVMRKYVK